MTIPDTRSLPNGPCLAVGAEISRHFVQQFSQRLLRDAKFRSEPALVSLGYWFRDSGVERWLARTFPPERCFVPRGTVFHIPPGNVETNYLYVWLLSVLVGNRNMVRTPTRESAVTQLVDPLLQELFAEPPFEALRAMNQFVRYGHEAEISAYYSSHCDVRIVSGSDSTIQQLRQIPLSPTAIEINLVEKSSFAVMDARSVNEATEPQLLSWARGLWQDVVGFEQLACNSIRAIWWLGEKDHGHVQKARERLWRCFEAVGSESSVVWPAAGVVQREGLLDRLGISDHGAEIVSEPGSPVTRVWLEKPMWGDPWFGGHGVLFETLVDSLEDLRPHLSRRQQTVASAGVSAECWRTFLTTPPVAGIDRVVRLGESLNFAATWDGFDLGRQLTREISLDL